MVTATEVHPVAPGVWVWSAYDSTVKCDLWSTGLVTPGGLVLIDPIDLAPSAFAELTNQAKPCAIVLTSGNHGRAAEALRARYDIPIWAPSAAAGDLPFRPDHEFTEADQVAGEIRATAIASAGPGEVALLREGVLCLGDAVINFGSAGFSLLPAKYCAAPDELPNDLRKLLSYDFHILTFAHGDPIVQHARDRLQKLLA